MRKKVFLVAIKGEKFNERKFFWTILFFHESYLNWIYCGELDDFSEVITAEGAKKGQITRTWDVERLPALHTAK